jgi:hypothetical protein
LRIGTDAAPVSGVRARSVIILWAEHDRKNASLKKTSKELKKTRTKLGVYLYGLKNLLAKTGRNGRWTSFLEGAGIPRATADRYVESHKRFLDRKNGNLPYQPRTRSRRWWRSSRLVLFAS